MERRLAAIFAADVVGYSRLIRADEEGTLIALKALLADIVEPQISAHQGRVVKLMGDGVLAEFASVVDAVSAALAIQDAVAAKNSGLPQAKHLQLRVGINLGDVVIDGDDIHGDGVNLAARLEGLAEPGGVCISDAVHEQVRDRTTFVFADGGLQDVKNIDRPVRVWAWPATGASGGIAVAPTAPPEKPSIAVLPFDNMSHDPEQDYFADGITEDIITEISRIAGLMVISRNSSFTYKGKAAKVQDVCRDLGVRYVLEGSVRKAGARVRITAQLIEGRSGGHLWAERYDRGLEDIFAVQDDVTEKIVGALKVKLVDSGAAEQERLGTDNPEAYDCVLRAREQYRRFSVEGNAAARALFERAIALDPDYATPYAGLAETYVQDWFRGAEPALDRAFELAEQAKARAPSLPLVQEALSTVHLFKRNHAEAIATAEQWIALEPNNADAHAALAAALMCSGQPERVFPLIDEAERLDPFFPSYFPLYRGQTCFLMARYEEAVPFIRRSIRLNPDLLPAHLFLAACYGHLGDDAQAEAALDDVHRLEPDFSVAWMKVFMPFKRRADLDRLVDGLHKAGLGHQAIN